MTFKFDNLADPFILYWKKRIFYKDSKKQQRGKIENC